MNEQIAATTRIVEEIVSRTQENLEEIVKVGQQQAEKAGQVLKANFEEISDLGQKNLDAVVESSKVLARSAEDAGQAAVTFTKSSSEASLAVLRKLVSAGSVTEAAEIQQTFAKDRIAALVAETDRLQALTVATARDAFTPLKARLDATMALFTKPLAA